MAEPGNTGINYYRSEVLDQPEIGEPLYGHDAVADALCGWLADQGLVAREVWFGRPLYRTDSDTAYALWERDGKGSEDCPEMLMELADEQVQKSNRPDRDRSEFCLVVASKPESPFSLLSILRFVDDQEISREVLEATLAKVRAARAASRQSGQAT